LEPTPAILEKTAQPTKRKLVESISKLSLVTPPAEAAARRRQQRQRAAEAEGPGNAVAQEAGGFGGEVVVGKGVDHKLHVDHGFFFCGWEGGRTVVQFVVNVFNAKRHRWGVVRLLYNCNYTRTIAPETLKISVLTHVGLQTRLDMRVPLLEALKHLFKQHVLLPEARRQIGHVRVGRLALEPQLRVRADDVLDPMRVEEHQHKVLELAVHGERLILLGRAAHVDAVLRLALGDDAWVKHDW